MKKKKSIIKILLSLILFSISTSCTLLVVDGGPRFWHRSASMPATPRVEHHHNNHSNEPVNSNRGHSPKVEKHEKKHKK